MTQGKSSMGEKNLHYITTKDMCCVLNGAHV